MVFISTVMQIYPDIPGVWFNKEAEVGVVYNPILEQMFYAKKGQGAFLNDKQIKVSGQTGQYFHQSFFLIDWIFLFGHFW